jgi:hypothetical protein
MGDEGVTALTLTSDLTRMALAKEINQAYY